MKVVHYSRVEAQSVEEEGAVGVTKRVLISEADGAEKFRMRCFEVAPGGSTPYHQHPWEHEVFVLDGEGACLGGDGAERRLTPGDALFMPPNEWHCFINKGGSTFRFLCLIPNPA